MRHGRVKNPFYGLYVAVKKLVNEISSLVRPYILNVIQSSYLYMNVVIKNDNYSEKKFYFLVELAKKRSFTADGYEYTYWSLNFRRKHKFLLIVIWQQLPFLHFIWFTIFQLTFSCEKADGYRFWPSFIYQSYKTFRRLNKCLTQLTWLS